MEATFGEEYTSVAMKLRGPGSRFMNSFESAKRNFGGPNDDRGVEIGPIRMDIMSSIHYDDEELVVKLSKYVTPPASVLYFIRYRLLTRR